MAPSLQQWQVNFIAVLQHGETYHVTMATSYYFLLYETSSIIKLWLTVQG
jgi:hypothetical protein